MPGLLKGIKYTTISTLILFVLRMFETIVFARIVGPENMGVFLKVFVIIESIGLVNALSTPTVIIQNQEDDKDLLLQNAFVLNMLIGFLFLCGCFIFSPWSSQHIEWVAILIGSKFFEIIFTPFLGFIEREFDFKKKGVVLIVSRFIATVMAYLFLVTGKDLVGLSIKFFVERILTLGFLLVIIKPKFNFRVEFRVIKIFLEKGLSLAFNTGTQKLKIHLDRLIFLSYMTTSTQYGIYAKSVDFVKLPGELFLSFFRNVFFSYFAKIQNQQQLFSLMLTKTHYILIRVLVLLCVFNAIFLDDFVYLLLGAEWADIKSYISLGAPLSLLLPLNTFARVILLSKGKYWVVSFLSFLELVIISGTMVISFELNLFSNPITALVIASTLFYFIQLAFVVHFEKAILKFSNIMLVLFVVVGVLLELVAVEPMLQCLMLGLSAFYSVFGIVWFKYKFKSFEIGGSRKK